MKITVNGKEVLLEKEITIKELLVSEKIEMPEYVTVQLNDEFVPTEDFDKVSVKDGDVFEFIYFMGGGRI